jgi:hypothetical protein
MDPITIVLLIVTSMNTLLHGYHLSRSTCMIDKCGVKISFGIYPNAKASSNSGILNKTPEMMEIARKEAPGDNIMI